LYLVSRGVDDIRGLIRLSIAHLHNIKVGGSERSEGYGELIAFIQDSTVKDLVRRAMRMDGPGRKDFQKSSQLAHLLLKTQRSLEIFNLPVNRREDELQKVLRKLDRDLAGTA
jgi:hypothetical protein